MVNENKIYEEFGRKLKKLREKSKMTQIEIAKKLDISRSALTQYENGVRKVPLNMVIKFATLYNVSVDELLDNEVEKEPQLTKYEVATEMGFTKDEISVLQSESKDIPQSFFEKFASYFNIDFDSLNLLKLEIERKHAVVTDDEVLMERYKKWQKEIGYAHFTDEEIEQLIDFAKYIISKRK